jgi:hypothetical protein
VNADAQALVDEYARRLSVAQGEAVSLTVALRKVQAENAELKKRLADIQEANGQ